MQLCLGVLSYTFEGEGVEWEKQINKKDRYGGLNINIGLQGVRRSSSNPFWFKKMLDERWTWLESTRIPRSWSRGGN